MRAAVGKLEEVVEIENTNPGALPGRAVKHVKDGLRVLRKMLKEKDDRKQANDKQPTG